MYHSWVEERLGRLGGILDPVAYAGRQADFMRDYAEAQRLGRIGYLLRVCRQARRPGARFDPHYQAATPIVINGRIVREP